VGTPEKHEQAGAEPGHAGQASRARRAIRHHHSARAHSRPCTKAFSFSKRVRVVPTRGAGRAGSTTWVDVRSAGRGLLRDRLDGFLRGSGQDFDDDYRHVVFAAAIIGGFDQRVQRALQILVFE